MGASDLPDMCGSKLSAGKIKQITSTHVTSDMSTPENLLQVSSCLHKTAY